MTDVQEILAELKAIRELLEKLAPALVRAGNPMMTMGLDGKLYRVPNDSTIEWIPTEGKIG